LFEKSKTVVIEEGPAIPGTASGTISGSPSGDPLNIIREVEKIILNEIRKSTIPPAIPRQEGSMLKIFKIELPKNKKERRKKSPIINSLIKILFLFSGATFLRAAKTKGMLPIGAITRNNSNAADAKLKT
jgi:hypothetical protein